MIRHLRRLDEVVLPRLARGLRRIQSAARRVRIRPLTAAAAVLVAAVTVTVVARLGEPSTSPSTGPYLRVGVVDGMSIAEYVAATRLELDRLAAGPDAADPVVALVALDRYLDPVRVSALAAGAGPQLVTIYGYARIPLPRRQTELVRLAAQRLPEDLVASMAATARRKAADAQEYERLAQAENDPALRQVLSSNAEVDAAEAAAYGDPHYACVFALVVRGAPAVLERLRDAEPVRTVDAAPEVTRLEATTFVAPLPEQTDEVRPPPDDALSTPSAR